MILNHRSFITLSLANSLSFYAFNWLALTLLIWLVFRIRHTGDDTNLKRESVVIVSIWVLGSILQYTVFIYNYVVTCNGEEGKFSPTELSVRYQISYKVVYWLIISRDLSCLITMIVF